MSVSASFNAGSVDQIPSRKLGPIQCNKCDQTATCKYYDDLCTSCFQFLIAKRLKDVLSQTCRVEKYDQYVNFTWDQTFLVFALFVELHPTTRSIILLHEILSSHDVFDLILAPVFSSPSAIFGYSGGASSTALLHLILSFGGMPMDPRPALKLLLGRTQDDGSLVGGQVPPTHHSARFTYYQYPFPEGTDVESATPVELSRKDLAGRIKDRLRHPIRFLPIMSDDSRFEEAFRSAQSSMAVPSPSIPQTVVEEHLAHQLQGVGMSEGINGCPQCTDPATCKIVGVLYPHYAPLDPENASLKQQGLPYIRTILTRARPMDVASLREQNISKMRRRGGKDSLPAEEKDVQTSLPVEGAGVPQLPSPKDKILDSYLCLDVLVVPLSWPVASLSTSPLTPSQSVPLDLAHRYTTSLENTAKRLPSSSAFRDLHSLLIARLLTSLGAVLSRPRVLVGDNLSELGVALVGMITKGNGPAVTLQAAFSEPRYFTGMDDAHSHALDSSTAIMPPKPAISPLPVMFTRAMRDVSAKAVHLVLHQLKAPYHPRIPILTRAELYGQKSLNSLTATFFAGLQRSNDGSVLGVVRTIEKLSINGVHLPPSRTRLLVESKDPMTQLKGVASNLEIGDAIDQTKSQCEKPHKHTKSETLIHSTPNHVNNTTSIERLDNITLPSATPSSSITETTVGRTAQLTSGDAWQGNLSIDAAEVRRRRLERGERVASEYMLSDSCEGDDSGATDECDGNMITQDNGLTTEGQKALGTTRSVSSLPSSESHDLSSTELNEMKAHDPHLIAVTGEGCRSSATQTTTTSGIETTVKQVKNVDNDDDDDDDDENDGPSCGRKDPLSLIRSHNKPTDIATDEKATTSTSRPSQSKGTSQPTSSTTVAAAALVTASTTSAALLKSASQPRCSLCLRGKLASSTSSSSIVSTSSSGTQQVPSQTSPSQVEHPLCTFCSTLLDSTSPLDISVLVDGMCIPASRLPQRFHVT